MLPHTILLTANVHITAVVDTVTEHIVVDDIAYEVFIQDPQSEIIMKRILGQL